MHTYSHTVLAGNLHSRLGSPRHLHSHLFLLRTSTAIPQILLAAITRQWDCQHLSVSLFWDTCLSKTPPFLFFLSSPDTTFVFMPRISALARSSADTPVNSLSARREREWQRQGGINKRERRKRRGGKEGNPRHLQCKCVLLEVRLGCIQPVQVSKLPPSVCASFWHLSHGYEHSSLFRMHRLILQCHCCTSCLHRQTVLLHFKDDVCAGGLIVC